MKKLVLLFCLLMSTVSFAQSGGTHSRKQAKSLTQLRAELRFEKKARSSAGDELAFAETGARRNKLVKRIKKINQKIDVLKQKIATARLKRINISRRRIDVAHGKHHQKARSIAGAKNPAL